MADDGTVDDEIKRPRRKQRGGDGSGPRGRQKPAEDQPADANAPIHPKDLPKFEDPQGRVIMPRHKRLALRKATELGLKPYNVNHAFHLLAERGIEVITGAEPMLNVVERAGKSANSLAVMENPDEMNALDSPAVAPPSPEAIEEDRDAAIRQIQLDLIRRRRRRLFALFLRLVVFVLLPTAAFGYYYSFIATEMFETESEFVIQTSENPAAAGGFGGILAGTGLATSQDSIVVQGYLGSREAFLRLDRDFGYIEHFQNPNIDVIQRLPADATLDDAYAYFKSRVVIGYDPTEGIIKMTVVAATPEDSQKFAEALVGYAEERVDGLTLEARGDQLETAISSFQTAERAAIESELRVQELQEELGVLSAEVELSGQMAIINSLELELENKRLALAQILDNPRPNRVQVNVAEAEIRRLESRIAELRGELTQNSSNSVSLAEISRELRSAELRLATRQLMLQEAIAAVTNAQTEANRQVRYLSLGVAPVAPVEATYPRKVESTILAFIIFLGAYILISLTVSILREQVSV